MGKCRQGWPGRDDKTSVLDVTELVPPPGNSPAAIPVYLSSGWEFASIEQADAVLSDRSTGTAYGNRDTPNHRALESSVAALEGAEDCLSLSGGMAAIATTFFALLRPGDRIVVSRDLFGLTSALLRDVERWGASVDAIDTTDPGEVLRALVTPAKLVYVETISNPRMRVPDLPALARLARTASSLLVVDNTLASPVHCRPADHGADLVIESVTKMMSGHSDVILGTLAGSAELIGRMRSFATRSGARPGAFDVWLAGRGLATLPLRQQRAAETAGIVAEWLVDQPGVGAVHFPGLLNHPDHMVASRQFSTFQHSGIRSLEFT